MPGGVAKFTIMTNISHKVHIFAYTLTISATKSTDYFINLRVSPASPIWIYGIDPDFLSCGCEICDR